MPAPEPGSAPEHAVFFETPEAFVLWLDDHHADAPFYWVGLYKAGSGKVNMTWPQSVDAALCFGWIDGQGKSLGDEARAIRFSPRRKGSIWSAVNVKRFGELAEEGRVRAAGHAAFAARREDRTAIYSHEQAAMPELEPAQLAAFEANAAAWDWFSARPPSTRKALIWWIVSAKKPETRERRLQTVIDEAAQGRLPAHMERVTPANRAKRASTGDAPGTADAASFSEST
ncbi:MAG: YdeI/OmpD-associated family protein [Thermomicrobiales bacterium]